MTIRSIPFLKLLSTFLLTSMSVNSGMVYAEHHPETSASEHISSIKTAHGGDAYYQQQAVQADFLLEFGALKIDATMLFTPSVGKARMDVTGLGTMVFDGQSVWVSPSTASVPGPPARFHVLTWPYFAAVPFKLDDPGTNHSDAGKREVTAPDDIRVGTKITFDAGVGDAPEDWYIAFSDDENRLEALAYIVTATKPKAEAEAQPSIILYSNFVEVDGATFATQWDFHFWSPESGIGDQKATAKLSNIKFVTPEASAFDKPSDAVESVMPSLASSN